MARNAGSAAPSSSSAARRRSATLTTMRSCTSRQRPLRRFAPPWRTLPTDDHLRRHRRSRLPRLAPLRSPAGQGPPGDLRRQPRHRLAPEHRPHPRREVQLRPARPDRAALHRRPVDFVYHLASPASPIDYARLPLHTLKVGSYGTHHMLGLAKAKRARFLLASTSEVYGDPQVHPQPEDYWGHVNPIGPRGVYDEAKRYAEALTMAYHRQQGVDTCIARIFNTYGARMRPHDGRAIPTFLRQALQDKPLTVFGDGSQTRSFCYVDDLIRGYVAHGRVRRPPAGEHRQPGRVHAARARQGRDRGDRVALRDRLRGAADRRPPGPPARHHPRPGAARLGAEGRACARACRADDRAGRRRAPRRRPRS